MNADQILEEPEKLGIDPQKLRELTDRVKQEVDSGLLPSAQIALARNGKLALFETFGEADSGTLYCIFSATKAITSAAAWLLIQDGALCLERKVADLIPEFAANGKEEVTVKQLFLHTCGFPHAPFRVADWPDKARRSGRFREWRLNWPPGSRFEYHATSSMWVIAELIERLSGFTYDAFIREYVSKPLRLDDLWVGIPREFHPRIATISHVGDPLSAEDYERLGVSAPPVTEVSPEVILAFNTADNRTIPVPGGGGVMSAAELALFYQGLIGNTISGERIWHSDTIADVTRPLTGDLKDPMTNVAVNRGLGIVVSGDEKRNYRGFGHTNSSAAFGHAGAGGQIAWLDPETGISFAYLTNGHDRNEVRQGRRGVSISNKAAVCLR